MMAIELAFIMLAVTIIGAALDTYTTFACLKYSPMLIERSIVGPVGATILKAYLIILVWIAMLYGIPFHYVLIFMGVIWYAASVNNLRMLALAMVLPPPMCIHAVDGEHEVDIVIGWKPEKEREEE